VTKEAVSPKTAMQVTNEARPLKTGVRALLHRLKAWIAIYPDGKIDGETGTRNVQASWLAGPPLAAVPKRK